MRELLHETPSGSAAPDDTHHWTSSEETNCSSADDSECPTHAHVYHDDVALTGQSEYHQVPVIITKVEMEEEELVLIQ